MHHDDRPPASRRCTASVWSRSAGLVLTALAGTLWMVHLTSSAVLDYDEVLAGTAAVTAVVAAAKLLRDNCFESRLAGTLLAALIGLGELLVAMVGRPGVPRAGWHAGGVTVTVLAVVVPLLIGLDARVRARSTDEVRPYAL